MIISVIYERKAEHFIVFFQIPNYSQKVHKQCKFVMFVIFPINDNNIFRSRDRPRQIPKIFVFSL